MSAVSPSLVAVVLAAALLHATWNAIVAGVDDRASGFALIGVVATVLGGALVLATGPPATWGLLVLSAALHVGYNLLLWASYRLGEFSRAYPLARGVAPLVVTVVSVTVLGRGLPGGELAGVLLICAGLIALVAVGGWPGRAQLPALGAAVATGLVIAAYTVVDAEGVSRGPLLPYVGALFLLQGPPMIVLAALRHRRSFVRRLRAHAVPGLAGGVASMAAYGLVLWAQTSGALAAVAALRETSIVFGALIGALFLGERLGHRRALAAAVVVAGIATLATAS